MHSRLVSWSRWLYLAGIVLALVLIVPTAWFPFQLGKIAVFATLLMVVVVFYVLGRGVPDLLETHGLKLALLAALLPLSYLVSMFFSTDRAVALIGYGLETDTVLFVTFVFLAFIISFTLFRTLRTARLLLSVLFAALIAAVIFQWVAVAFGTSVLPFSTFADRSANLIGKWNDLGLLAGLLGMLILVWGEFARTAPLRRGLGVAMAVGVAVLLGIINFPLVWGIIFGFSIILGVTAFLMQHSSGAIQQEEKPNITTPPTSLVEKAPWFAVGGAIVSLLFLVFGATLSTGLASVFPVSSLEVRPSYSATLDIINDSHSSVKQLFVGTGPNTFGENWIMYKPLAVNQTQFWSLDFNVGFSTVMTALDTVGFLGAIAWLIPSLLILAGLLRAVRLGVLSREERFVAASLSIAGLFLMTAAVLYVPSQNILLLAFTLSGAAFGFLWRQGRSSASTAHLPQSLLSLFNSAFVALLLLAVTLWAGYTADRRFVAQAFVGQGSAALNRGDADQALRSAAAAYRADAANTNATRLILGAGVTKLQNLANTPTPTADTQTEFANTVSQSIAAGLEAASTTPRDYRPVFALGNVYNLLASLNVQGAYENARTLYQRAVALNPTNPAIELSLARLEAVQGNSDLARQHIQKALTLKPNYTDAILLVVQLEVANNDIPSAIQAATAAAQTAPGVAPIWFQLGLLYYSNGDMAKAIPALERALSITPEYANAKYFLGLSYYAQKRTEDATKQFEDLQKTNPDNSEVQLVISNMAAGREPFASSTPPLSPPQGRTSAPIPE
ncbi:tetratricopeptide repeat protein [Patescibacteria group bacterium]|nr:tetratricopeptide repeat protein [Patescibacteria group bacterium]